VDLQIGWDFTYLQERKRMSKHADYVSFLILTDDGSLLENCSDRERENQGCKETVYAKLPCLFAFPRAGVDARHEEDNVEARGDVEDLEDDEPYVQRFSFGVDVHPEEVEVAAAEDDGV
jgi:hypothetical protein